ncbi:MAG: transcriptional regulator MraZ [Planctomycetaceae bacterium]|nr:MAG: transcriptional regulator MraZ [Planctomycetaceae bacterium]
MVHWAAVGLSGRKWGRMPLTGTYLRAIDEKRRLAIPKRLREDFGEGNVEHLYIAPGTEKSLLLYAPRAFAALAERLRDRTNHLNANQINYLRLFYSSAERVDLDAQGRIRIPDRLADLVGLGHEAYLLGVHDHAEIWDKDRWDSFSSQLVTDFDQLAYQAYRGPEYPS